MSLRDREKRDPCGLVDLGGGVCPEDVRPRLCVLAGAEFEVRQERSTEARTSCGIPGRKDHSWKDSSLPKPFSPPCLQLFQLSSLLCNKSPQNSVA